jgi:hypothetical protein
VGEVGVGDPRAAQEVAHLARHLPDGRDGGARPRRRRAGRQGPRRGAQLPRDGGAPAAPGLRRAAGRAGRGRARRRHGRGRGRCCSDGAVADAGAGAGAAAVVVLAAAAGAAGRAGVSMRPRRGGGGGAAGRDRGAAADRRGRPGGVGRRRVLLGRVVPPLCRRRDVAVRAERVDAGGRWRHCGGARRRDGGGARDRFRRGPALDVATGQHYAFWARCVLMEPVELTRQRTNN